MKFSEIILKSEAKIFLGKNAENNDELVKEFKGKENIIIHTVEPGSPFCVIEKLNPTKKEIQEAAIICASKSHDWRDNKKDVNVCVFSGKEVYKINGMKTGTWGVRKKENKIKVKKEDILRVLKR